MRVQLTRRTRAFSVLGNDVLQDPGISYPALGVLVHLLSLPDGARIDVRVLADRRTGLGRQGVANALDELVKAGYYVRRTVRDSETGRIRTETLIRDTRHDTGSTKPPLPAPTGTGRPAKGAPGTFPDGKKTPGKKPTHPVPDQATCDTSRPVTAELPRQRRADGTPPADTPHPRTQATDTAVPAEPSAIPAVPSTSARGVALLTRLGRYEPRLALGASDTHSLAHLAENWLSTGVSEPESRALLTEGLPQVIRNPRALLADRLTRKLPNPRRESATRTPALAECRACHDPLPRGHSTAVCGPCSGAATPAPPPRPETEAFAARVTQLRAMVRSQRAAALAAM